jgi:hypothetical protein
MAGCGVVAPVGGLIIAAGGASWMRDLDAQVARGNNMAGLLGPLALMVIPFGALLALAGAIFAFVGIWSAKR